MHEGCWYLVSSRINNKSIEPIEKVIRAYNNETLHMDVSRRHDEHCLLHC